MSPIIVPKCLKFDVKSCTDIVNDCNLQGLLNRRSKVPDHALVTVQFCINAAGTRSDDTVINTESMCVKRRYHFNSKSEHFMNSDIFKGSILKVIQSIECNREAQEDLDSIYSEFSGVVLNEMNQHVPYSDSSHRVKKRFKPRKSFWNDELNELWLDMSSKEKLVMTCKISREKKERFKSFRLVQHVFDRRFRFFERKSRLELVKR